MPRFASRASSMVRRILLRAQLSWPLVQAHHAPLREQRFDLLRGRLVPRRELAEADDRVVGLAALAADQRGQDPDVEPLGEVLRLLRVELHEARAPVLLGQLLEVLVHDLAPPRALAPEVDDDLVALLGDVKELLLVDHLVLPMPGGQLRPAVRVARLHLLEPLPPDLLDVVLFDRVQARELLVELGLFLLGDGHHGVREELDVLLVQAHGRGS
mmetsp:Transcript_71665/g.221659  ORF Transcript_71665/g.221659 Transcript_71665/m.221659 type:complete len:214 (+) Transcript_71665:236-877(+)